MSESETHFTAVVSAESYANVTTLSLVFHSNGDLE